jgi:CelD/BcsL family acetyltransferase involved in cellulose biosynthesis
LAPAHAVPQAPNTGPGALAPVAVEEVGDRAAIDGLSSEWDGLRGRAREASLFSSCDWMSAWLESFARGRVLVLLLARREGTLVGVLPLLQGTTRWLAGSRGLEGPANEQTPCGSLLCDGDPAPVLAAFLAHLRRTRGAVPVRLPSLPADSAALQAFRDIAAAGPYRAHVAPSRCSARIVIQGTWAEYLATRTKHTTREWRRKRKRLDEAGRVETKTVSTLAELPAALDDVLYIERRSWKHGEGTSFQREEGVSDFYGRLAERGAACGWLRLSLLYLDGRPAAHCFAVVDGGELLALKTSFDAELGSLSPGLALMLALCEQAFADGLGAIDLLGHPDRWKLEMSNEQRAHVDLCVFPRGLIRCEACVFVEDRLEPLVREKLPPRLRVVARALVARLRKRG